MRRQPGGIALPRQVVELRVGDAEFDDLAQAFVRGFFGTRHQERHSEPKACGRKPDWEGMQRETFLKVALAEIRRGTRRVFVTQKHRETVSYRAVNPAMKIPEGQRAKKRKASLGKAVFLNGETGIVIGVKDFQSGKVHEWKRRPSFGTDFEGKRGTNLQMRHIPQKGRMWTEGGGNYGENKAKIFKDESKSGRASAS